MARAPICLDTMDVLGAQKWIPLVSRPEPGTHTIFWSDGSDPSERVLLTFVRGALERDDLLVIILPRADMERLEWALKRDGLDLERDSNEGRVLRTVAEDIQPKDVDDAKGIASFMEDLERFAVSSGRSGVSILGKVAPLFFERRDQGMAERLEHLAPGHPSRTRVLCAYDAKTLTLDRMADAIALTRLHTHSITAIGGGQFFVETLHPPPEILV